MPEEHVGVDDRLAEAFLTSHPAEAARAVEQLSEADLVTMVGSMPASVIAPVIARMDQLLASRVVSQLDHDTATGIVGAIDAAQAGLLIRRLPEPVRDGILERLPARLAGRLRDVLRYPTESAAALCDPGVLTVAADLTAADAIAAVRGAGRAYYYVFVVDRDQRLVGVVNLRELLSAAPDTPVRKIARTDVVKLLAGARSSVILAHPAWRDLAALPVVDAQGRFLGLLRHETVRLLEAEASNKPLSEAATTMVLDFGELVWTTGGEVLGELAHAVAPRTGSTREASSDG